MTSIGVVRIQPVGFSQPVTKAAEELAAYLPRLAPVSAAVLPSRPAAARDPHAHLTLGTSQHLGGLGLGRLPRTHELDDAFAILPRNGQLFLVGANPRSVLFAAYRLLEELGAIFLRPGPGGEILPRAKRLRLPPQPIREKASYRHRGICIEGAPRLEHALDLLDWMAKKKMNALQLQFQHAGVFWRRGYSSPEMNGAARANGLAEADCLAIDEQVIARVKRLGLMLHHVGHGWTARALGFPGHDWNERPAHELSPEKRPWVAQVGGKRELWHDEPTNTELCYSKPAARQAFVAEVLAYARRHPEVDFLHVWLSDGADQHCECADCRKQSPSDWYALLISEVSRALEAETLPTRVVFLAYNDILWPPEKVRPEGSNIVFMYAPSARCLVHPLDDPKCGDGENSARPSLNRTSWPFGCAAVADVARTWQQLDPPDSFLFCYHQWLEVWGDGLGVDLGATMARDVKALAGLGLDGLMSCQCFRSFYPTPYLANAMADTLWNRNLAPDTHRRRLLQAAFGTHAEEVDQYFSRVVAAFRIGDSYEHRRLTDGVEAADAPRLEEASALAEAACRRFSGLAEGEQDPVVATSLRLVALHAEQVTRIARIHLAGLSGDRDGLQALRAEQEARLPQVLRDLAPWVDPLLAGPVAQALEQAERAAQAKA